MDIDSQPPLTQVMDLLIDAVCVVDAAGRFVYVSAAFERIFGYRPDEIIGSAMIDLVFHEDRERTLNRVDQIVAGGSEQTHFENRYLRKDGRVVDIMWSARWSAAHRIRVAVARDVTDRKRAETVQSALYAISEAAQAATELDALLERVRQIIGTLLPVQELQVALQDGTEGHAAGIGPDDGADDQADEAVATGRQALVRAVIDSGRTLYLTGAPARPAPFDEAVDADREAVEWLGAPLRRQDRVVGALLVRCRPGEVRYADGDIDLLVFVAKQVAAAIDRQNAVTALHHAARHDPLTDLPNRNLVRDRVTTALARARRDGTMLSLLYLDLDRFKEVNDRFGHALGDQLLCEIAHRLKRSVRESDTVGRMGGDEFVILLGRIQSPDDASLIAEKVRAALSEPYVLGNHTLTMAPSVGVAHFPQHGDDYERLLHCADEAMYLAKQDGGNRVRVAASAG